MREAWDAAIDEAESKCADELTIDTNNEGLRHNNVVRDCLRAIKKAGNG